MRNVKTNQFALSESIALKAFTTTIFHLHANFYFLNVFFKMIHEMSFFLYLKGLNHHVEGINANVKVIGIEAGINCPNVDRIIYKGDRKWFNETENRFMESKKENDVSKFQYNGSVLLYNVRGNCFIVKEKEKK